MTEGPVIAPETMRLLGSGGVALAFLLAAAAADYRATDPETDAYSGPAPLVGGLAGIAAAMALIALLD
ncbi:hypothetical protein O4J56_06905 [Nocardiopsis sp. RSe5-2]|uniref:Tripartite tricarboxylate transporter TctB family protein n=1 Tax=Nocardiopsis endophytica TaxID=3018445 RepID=A0ABT4U1I5_9ACTN|nr:hypothetical protein [Nocardiopsis endophytica]MDA2810364.1 hypothetical protein [Nocardiopsis endophytica]